MSETALCRTARQQTRTQVCNSLGRFHYSSAPRWLWEERLIDSCSDHSHGAHYPSRSVFGSELEISQFQVSRICPRITVAKAKRKALLLSTDIVSVFLIQARLRCMAYADMGKRLPDKHRYPSAVRPGDRMEGAGQATRNRICSLFPSSFIAKARLDSQSGICFSYVLPFPCLCYPRREGGRDNVASGEKLCAARNTVEMRRRHWLGTTSWSSCPAAKDCGVGKTRGVCRASRRTAVLRRHTVAQGVQRVVICRGVETAPSPRTREVKTNIFEEIDQASDNVELALKDAGGTDWSRVLLW